MLIRSVRTDCCRAEMRCDVTTGRSGDEGGRNAAAVKLQPPGVTISAAPVRNEGQARYLGHGGLPAASAFGERQSRFASGLLDAPQFCGRSFTSSTLLVPWYFLPIDNADGKKYNIRASVARGASRHSHLASSRLFKPSRSK